MTRKTVLASWAKSLGADLPADPTVSQLEAGIDKAIADLAAPQPTIGQAITANWKELKAGAIPAVKAVAHNLRTGEILKAE